MGDFKVDIHLPLHDVGVVYNDEGSPLGHSSLESFLRAGVSFLEAALVERVFSCIGIHEEVIGRANQWVQCRIKLKIKPRVLETNSDGNNFDGKYSHLSATFISCKEKVVIP